MSVNKYAINELNPVSFINFSKIPINLGRLWGKIIYKQAMFQNLKKLKMFTKF